jgi:hypothetical protein
MCRLKTCIPEYENCIIEKNPFVPSEKMKTRTTGISIIIKAESTGDTNTRIPRIRSEYMKKSNIEKISINSTSS